MSTRKKYALRSARSGTGLLPPNPKQWENEHNGLDVRHALGLPTDAALDHKDAFGLLNAVSVLAHTELALSDVVAHYFTGSRSHRWSGMCVPCPNGETLVIYNAHQTLRRNRATLMEEFFHLWLEHPPTKLRVFSKDALARDFDPAKESEAYGSGAAALVPYKTRRCEQCLKRRERFRPLPTISTSRRNWSCSAPRLPAWLVA